MVLYPLIVEAQTPVACAPSAGQFVPAFEAIEKRQRQPAQEWWLIAQPDHAALAGDLAAQLASPLIPALDSVILRAIALHDSGWARFDGGERGTGRDLEVSLRDPKLDSAGRPLSFLEMSPEEFIVAWTESIQNAEKTGPAGGIIVSRHFCRLAHSRLHSYQDTREDTNRLHTFLAEESKRQERLLALDSRASEELDLLTDVLQFCDLLSLYLCCGATDNVQFPQKFKGQSIRLQREGELARLQPTLFSSGLSLGVTARGYPRFGAVEITTLPFLIE
jgi:hypothetical protein